MKKLVYKDVRGSNPKKREVSVEEINDKSESRVSKKWICKYFVKDKFESKDTNRLKNWVKTGKKSVRANNHHILREVNTKTGENKIVCKVLGEFFAITGYTAYKIVYVNEIRIYIGEASLEDRSIKWRK